MATQITRLIKLWYSKISSPRLTPILLKAGITEVEGRLAIKGHSVGEATITIVLAEPTTVVRVGVAGAADDSLRHAGLGQYAVQSFTVRVLRQGTPISN